MKKEVWMALGAVVVVLGLIMFLGQKNEETAITTAEPTNTMSKTITQATFVTNLGEITVELYPNKSPETVANFVKLAQSGFYEGTKFHRVIKDFMIQGGDPNSKGDDKSTYGRGGPGYSFNDEITDVPLVKGVLAMANSGPNTNGSQFFIITAPETPWLQGHHTAFGKVTMGMDVADKISMVAKDQNDVPLTPVVVEKVILK